MTTKAFLIQLTLLATGIMNIPAQEVKKVDIVFDLDDFNISSNGENPYSIEALNQDFYYPEDPSLPAIPLKCIWVLVPNGAELIDYSIETVEDIVEEDILLRMATLPVPTNSLDCGEIEEPNYTGIFPGKSVEYTSIMIQRGFTWFSFQVSPFRYNGQNKELTFISRINLRIDYRISEQNSSSVHEDEALVQNLKIRLVNPEDQDRFYPPSRKSVLKSAEKRIDYLVVTTGTLKTGFNPLLEWKTRKGLSVDIITLEEIEENYTDATIQLKIKRCLKDYYDHKNLRWVLLAGDSDIIPVQGCYSEVQHGGIKDESIPTDLFYACFDKRFDWNSWKDEKIGQRCFDNVDVVPEIYISRIPVRTQEHVQSFVNKILNYETVKFQKDYVGRILFAGTKIFNFWEGKSDSHHRSELIYSEYVAENHSGEKIRFFDTGTDFIDGDKYDVTSSNLADQINSGYGIVHFAGHGRITGFKMESGSRFDVEDASKLNNQDNGIILSNACQAGAFDSEDPCLAEELLINPRGGCVAYWGSSRYGFANQSASCNLGPSLNFNARFFKYLFNNESGSGWNSFATIASLSKTSFTSYGTPKGTYHYLLYSVNALGDPEMPIFTQNPSRFDNVLIDRSGNSITVHTGGIISTICVTSHDLELGYQQVAENVSCHTFHNVPDSLQVTITAPNYVPSRHFYPCQDPAESATGMENGFDTSIIIYPNPTNGQISVNLRELKTCSIKITSLNGQVLHSIDSAESTVRIDLSTFQKGIYIITIRSKDFAIARSIIKL